MIKFLFMIINVLLTFFVSGLPICIGIYIGFAALALMQHEEVNFWIHLTLAALNIMRFRYLMKLFQ